MPFEGLSFVKTLVKFGIIYATDHFYKIRLRSFAYFIELTLREISYANIVRSRARSFHS